MQPNADLNTAYTLLSVAVLAKSVQDLGVYDLLNRLRDAAPAGDDRDALTAAMVNLKESNTALLAAIDPNMIGDGNGEDQS